MGLDVEAKRILTQMLLNSKRGESLLRAIQFSLRFLVQAGGSPRSASLRVTFALGAVGFLAAVRRFIEMSDFLFVKVDAPQGAEKEKAISHHTDALEETAERAEVVSVVSDFAVLAMRLNVFILPWAAANAVIEGALEKAAEVSTVVACAILLYRNRKKRSKVETWRRVFYACEIAFELVDMLHLHGDVYEHGKAIAGLGAALSSFNLEWFFS